MAFVEIENRSTVMIILLIILIVVMVVCLSMVQSEANKMEPPPKFIGSRYFYILIISFGVLFISFFTGTLSNASDFLFYSTVIIISLGITGDLYILLGTKDISAKSDY